MTWGAAQWDTCCAAHLGKLFEGDEIAHFKAKIETGEWLLLAGWADGQRVASAVVGLGSNGKGRVLHCYALAGNSTGQILKNATGFLVGMARDLDCIAARYETGREALMKHMEKLGGQVRYVCVLEVAGNG